jgi:hypothetical protein
LSCLQVLRAQVELARETRREEHSAHQASFNNQLAASRVREVLIVAEKTRQRHAQHKKVVEPDARYKYRVEPEPEPEPEPAESEAVWMMPASEFERARSMGGPPAGSDYEDFYGLPEKGGPRARSEGQRQQQHELGATRERGDQPRAGSSPPAAAPSPPAGTPQRQQQQQQYDENDRPIAVTAADLEDYDTEMLLSFVIDQAVHSPPKQTQTNLTAASFAASSTTGSSSEEAAAAAAAAVASGLSSSAALSNGGGGVGGSVSAVPIQAG